MDLEVVGRHALLFDDDAQSAFVNSRSALVPWSGDPSLLIDRYDVRHLLSSIPTRQAGRAYVELGVDGLSRSDLDRDRYLDLPSEEASGGWSLSEAVDNGKETVSGTYQAVPFSYGSSDASKLEDGPEYSGFQPPFPLPENCWRKMNFLTKPPTEKLHHIIAKTALFVSRHGGQSEIVLRVKQGDNPTFGFLMPAHEFHPYYRFLVEHPRLLESYAVDAREEKNPSGNVDNESKPASGALSLLGSTYGSLDEDEGTIQESPHSKVTELGNPADAVHAEKSPELNKATPTDNIGTEIKLSPCLKENTQSLRKNPPVVPPNSVSASSKAKVPFISVDTSASKANSTMTSIEKMIVEPPSTMKEAVSKLVEFILRNGREFESVLIEQDRPHGRFPFLLPSNLYHSYYLKVLEEAQEYKRNGKRSSDNKHDSQRRIDGRKSRESSVSASQSSPPQLEGLYDPERKEKFKMVIGASKKDIQESSSRSSRETGVSVDVAAAIVMAATRGLSNPTDFHAPTKPSSVNVDAASRLSGLSADAAAAIVMAATRGSISPPNSSGRPKMSAHSQSLHSSSFGSLSALGNGSISISGLVTNADRKGNISGPADGIGIGGTDRLKVANAIARNIALATASEADSSEATMTKEQKLKAERLKRAKLFTSMIKNGVCDTGKPLSVVTLGPGTPTVGSGSILSGSISDLSRKEREGSSVLVDTDATGKCNDRVTSSHHGSKHSSNEHASRLGKRDNDGDELEHRHMRSRKYHDKTSSEKEEHRHKRQYRSLSRSDKYESSSEDEMAYQKRSRGHSHHSKKHHSSPNDKHCHQDRKSKSCSERNRESKRAAMETILEHADCTPSTSQGAAPSISRSRQGSAEVPDGLRAKVREMLAIL